MRRLRTAISCARGTGGRIRSDGRHLRDASIRGAGRYRKPGSCRPDRAPGRTVSDARVRGVGRRRGEAWWTSGCGHSRRSSQSRRRTGCRSRRSRRRSSRLRRCGRRAQGVLVRVLGVLGGTFVFAGVGVFIALQWDELNAAARVIVTLGSGLAAFVLAVLGTREPRFDKAAAPLFLMAAALEPPGCSSRSTSSGRAATGGWPASSPAARWPCSSR